MPFSMHKEPLNNKQMDSSKYVRYTPEQIEALERVYNECPKPSSLRRQQLIRECPILSNIEPKQIKVWFQNRRSRKCLFSMRTYGFCSLSLMNSFCLDAEKSRGRKLPDSKR
ncbi:hypothetical protein V6N13_132215 [Hibiscus sabdariffa]